MAVRLYMDVHVAGAITDQLRKRGVEIITAQDDAAAELRDDELLLRARTLGALLFTHDIRFAALAEAWQREGKPFSGLLFGHQLSGTIGEFVADLELIAKASELGEWENIVDRIPYRRWVTGGTP